MPNLTPDQLVAREVHYCVSSLVSTLAVGGHGTITFNGLSPRNPRLSPIAPIMELCDQAAELAAPIDDWEEAAIQVGWKPDYDGDGVRSPNDEDWSETYETACASHNIEPYQREVFEHWIVSDWLADKLEARGEKVDRDFAGLTVWARTTSGQLIAADSVIESICRDLPGEIEAALAAIGGEG